MDEISWLSIKATKKKKHMILEQNKEKTFSSVHTTFLTNDQKNDTLLFTDDQIKPQTPLSYKLQNWTL